MATGVEGSSRVGSGRDTSVNFTRIEFLFFLVGVLAAVWSAADRRLRCFLLLVFSYYFYAYWDWRFCGLLAFSTMVDYVAGQQIEEGSEGARRGWLTVSLLSNLGMLGFFKYAGFFVDSARLALEPLGVFRGFGHDVFERWRSNGLGLAWQLPPSRLCSLI